MSKNTLIYLLGFAFLFLTIGFVSAAAIEEDIHLNIQTTYSNGSIETGTFDFVFNITTNTNCAVVSDVIYSDSATIATDSRAIISYYLENVSLDFDEQYYLCYYRDTVLQGSATQIARTPYTFRAKNMTLTGLEVDTDLEMGVYNVTANWFKGLFNWSAIGNFLSFNGSILSFDESLLNTTIDLRSLWNQTGDDIYYTAGKVGIGTDTPQTLFHLKNDSLETQLRIQAGTAGYSPTLQFYDSAGAEIGEIYGDVNDGLRFQTGTLDRLTIDSSGFLGLGTTSPNTTFHIQNATGDTELRLTPGESTGSGAIQFYNDTSEAAEIYNAWSDDALRFQTANQDRMAIDSSGNVGIGTNTPGANLQVNTSGDTELRLSTSNDAGTTALQFYNATGEAAEIYAHADNSIRFQTGDPETDQMTILDDGKVGINTATPQNTLNVLGDLNVTGTIYDSSGSDLADIYVDEAGDTMTGNLTAPNLIGRIYGYFFNWTEDSNYLSFDGSTLSFSESTLNTTIGIYNDSMKSYVDAQDIVFNDSMITHVNYTNWTMLNYVNALNVSQANWVIALDNATNNSMAAYVNALNVSQANWATDTFVDETGDTMTGALNLTIINPSNYGNLTIDAGTLFVDAVSDRVGIGTSSPDTMLHIIRDSASPEITWERTTTQTAEMKLAAYSNLFELYDVANSRRIFISTADGSFNVEEKLGIGIGTTDPGSLLTVAQSATTNEVNLSDTLFVNSTSGNVGIGTSSPEHDLHIYDDAPYIVIEESDETYEGWKIGGYQKNFHITDDSGGTIAADSAITILDETRYVGIGTITPQNLLNVLGDANVTGTFYAGTISATTQTLIDLWVTNNATIGKNLSVDTNVLFVDAESDRVGIGTSSPNDELTVVGTVNATDFVCASGTDCLGTDVIDDIYVLNTGDIMTGNLNMNTSGASDNSTSDSSDIIFTGKYDSNSSAGGIIQSTRDITLRNIMDWDTGAGDYRLGFLDDAGAEFVTFEGDTQRVGIGTSSPEGKLSVKGTAYGVAENSQTGLSLDSSGIAAGSGNFGTGIEFSKLGTANNKRAAIVPVQQTADSDTLGLAFFASPSTTSTDDPVEYMRIIYGGNVGIGTDSPSNVLHVLKTQSGATKIEVENQDTGTVGLSNFLATAKDVTTELVSHGSGRTVTRYGVTVGGWSELIAPTGNGLLIGTSTLDNPIVFGNNNLERMRIDAGGNVGIGTDSPGAALHVNGTSIPLKIERAGENEWSFEITNSYGASTKSFNLHPIDNDADILFSPKTDGTLPVIIKASGNVGINTTTPQNTLNVVGEINVTNNDVSMFMEGGMLVVSG